MYLLATERLNGGATKWDWLDVDLKSTDDGRMYAVTRDGKIVQEDPVGGRKLVAASTPIGTYEECVKDGNTLVWRPRAQDSARVYLCLAQPNR